MESHPTSTKTFLLLQGQHGTALLCAIVVSFFFVYIRNTAISMMDNLVQLYVKVEIAHGKPSDLSKTFLLLLGQHGTALLCAIVVSCFFVYIRNTAISMMDNLVQLSVKVEIAHGKPSDLSKTFLIVQLLGQHGTAALSTMCNCSFVLLRIYKKYCHFHDGQHGTAIC